MVDEVMIVLPDEERDGIGIYPEDELFMVKRLRAEGIEAQFQHDADHRMFRCLRNDPGYVVFLLNVATGVVSSAVYSMLAAAIRHNRDRKLRVRFTRRSRPDGEVEEEFEATGLGADVQEAFDSYLARHSRSDIVAKADEEVSAPRTSPSAQKGQELRQEAVDTMRLAQSDVGGEGEQHARRALALMSSALDRLEDTTFEDAVHEELHAFGRWTREHFPVGCALEWTGTEYHRTCPVDLAHTRMGFSLGFLAKKRYTLCEQDLSECDHLPDVEYAVAARRRSDGNCSICMAASCEQHIEGQTYLAKLWSEIVEMNVEEISLVDRPMIPTARLTVIDVSIASLREEFGDEFSPGMPIQCSLCLSDCDGLRRPLQSS